MAKDLEDLSYDGFYHYTREALELFKQTFGCFPNKLEWFIRENSDLMTSTGVSLILEDLNGNISLSSKGSIYDDRHALAGKDGMHLVSRVSVISSENTIILTKDNMRVRKVWGLPAYVEGACLFISNKDPKASWGF